MKNVEDVYPLTPVQEGMLFHTLSAPDSGIYLTQISFQLEGTLEPETFERAWRDTVAAHPALRTAFLWEGLETPLQVVRETVDLSFRFTENATQHAIETFLKEDRKSDFTLEKAPLVRLHLFQLKPDCHRLIWSFHHLVSDGWSTPLILTEIFQRYDGHSPSEPAPAYRNFIDWRQEQDTAGQEAFWRNELEGFTQPLTCPQQPSLSAGLTHENIEGSWRVVQIGRQDQARLACAWPSSISLPDGRAELSPPTLS